MSWVDSVSKNLINKIEINIGHNKSITTIVDGNIQTEYYYDNEIITKNPACDKTNIINQTTNLKTNK